jgi:hypothetical protein
VSLDGAILFSLGLLFFTWGSWYVVKWGYFVAARFSIKVERKVNKK